MDMWDYGEETAWAGTLAIAETLGNYLEKYIMKQYGYDKKEAYAGDVEQLRREIAVVTDHIKAIRERL